MIWNWIYWNFDSSIRVCMALLHANLFLLPTAVGSGMPMSRPRKPAGWIPFRPGYYQGQSHGYWKFLEENSKDHRWCALCAICKDCVLAYELQRSFCEEEQGPAPNSAIDR
jgi:hypothetical protein